MRESGESSDDDTIRSEDRYSEEETVGNTSLSHRSKEAGIQEKRRESKDKQNSTKNTSATGRNTNAVKADFGMAGQPASVVANLAQFPIIQALMAEIMHLQGAVQTTNVVNNKTRGVSYRLPGDNQHHQFLNRQGKRGNVFYAGHGGAKYIRECKIVNPTSPVPKNKSWIREQPRFVASPANVHQSKITPGMTNTQRLRLAQTNPKLLKELEVKEEERLRQWKEQERILKGRSGGGGDTAVERTVESNIQHIRNERISDAEMDRVVSAQYHKRPVPTPRSSMLPVKRGVTEMQYAVLPVEREDAASESGMSVPKPVNEAAAVQSVAGNRKDGNVIRVAEKEKVKTIRDDWEEMLARVGGIQAETDLSVDYSVEGLAVAKNNPLLGGTYKLDHAAIAQNTSPNGVSDKPLFNRNNENDQHSAEVSSKSLSAFGQTQILVAPSWPIQQMPNVQTPGTETKQKKAALSPGSKKRTEGQRPLTDRSQGGKGQEVGTDYSDDFEEHLTTNRETNSVVLDDDDDFDIGQLRMIVERYSDDDDDDTGGEGGKTPTGEEAHLVEVEPDLKKIVNHYSDDDDSEDTEKTIDSQNTYSFKLGEEVCHS